MKDNTPGNFCDLTSHEQEVLTRPEVLILPEQESQEEPIESGEEEPEAAPEPEENPEQPPEEGESHGEN